MRQLAKPLGSDPVTVSGESGAAGLGCALELLVNDNLVDIKQKLDINEKSLILCFSTEGDTDRENYKKIVE